jgi:hypothetical protein
LTHNEDRVSNIITKAAKSASFSWGRGEDGLDDLISDLWVWYLERPGTQAKLADSDEFLARRLVYKAALQILAASALSGDKFRGRNLYSSESVKEELLGTSKNGYLSDIIPRALEELSAKNEGQAEAIRLRYVDGVVPFENAAQQVLKRAVKSLTEHVNVIVITTGVDSEGNVKEGPGSRAAVFPETRRPKGYVSDPTGYMAILLLDNPVQDGISLRDEYLHDTSLQDFLEGKVGA